MKHYFFLALLCFLFGCKKDDNSIPSKNYKFVNYTGQRVTMEFYKTKGDLNNIRKILKTVILDDSADVSLTLDTTYYIDWYSEDYRATNWQNSTNGTVGYAFPKPDFFTDPEFSRIAVEVPIEVDMVTPYRKLLISGNKASQVWKAVAFYPDGSTDNAWDQLSNPFKEIEFTIKKDFSITFDYQDEDGNDKETKATMKVYFDKFKIQFTNSNHVKGEIKAAEPFSYNVLEFHCTDSARLGKYILQRED